LNKRNHVLIVSAYRRTPGPRQSEFHVSDFYPHLPPNIPQENQKEVAQHIVDVLGHQGHYQFTFDKQYQLKRQPCRKLLAHCYCGGFSGCLCQPWLLGLAACVLLLHGCPHAAVQLAGRCRGPQVILSSAGIAEEKQWKSVRIEEARNEISRK
jgi:hypothetical protein